MQLCRNSFPVSGLDSSRLALAPYFHGSSHPHGVSWTVLSLLHSCGLLSGYSSTLPPDMHRPRCMQLMHAADGTAHPRATSSLPWLLFSSQCFSDYDECEMREDDCEPGMCRNTFGSYTCSCDGGGPDSHVEYSGRSCDGKFYSLFWSVISSSSHLRALIPKKRSPLCK